MSTPAVSLATSAPAITILPKPLIRAPYAVPDALQQFLDRIEVLAVENERQAMWDGWKLWSFKAPAILAAACSGAIAFLNGPAVWIVILTGILGCCVVLDGMLHPGERRDVHRRAGEGLRNLERDLASRWRIASFAGLTSSTTLAQILEDGWREWKRIHAYVEGNLFAGHQEPTYT